MKKSNLCKRCRELVFETAIYDDNIQNTNADLYKKFRQVERKVKELSYIVENKAAKELL